MRKSNVLLVLSGPSAGVGKDTVKNILTHMFPEWVCPISVTTRKPRTGEVDGRDMQFVEPATFKKWQQEELFVESVKVDDGQWYGTLREPIDSALAKGKNVILRKDVRGGLLIKKAFPKQAILIFIEAESWQAMEARIRQRATEEEASITRKLNLAKQEMTYKDKYDFVVINPTGAPEKAAQEIASIVQKTQK